MSTQHPAFSLADRMDLWRELTLFERLYGYPSSERHKAFQTTDGRVRHDQDYEQWSDAWAAWQVVTRSDYVPECIDTGELEELARLRMVAGVVHGMG